MFPRINAAPHPAPRPAPRGPPPTGQWLPPLPTQVKCPSLWAPKPIQLMWYGIQRCFSPVPFHSPRTLYRYRKTEFKRVNNLQDSSMKRNLRKPAEPEPRTPSLTRPKLFLFTGLPPVPKLAFQTGLWWKVIITIKGSSTTFIQNKFHFPLLSSPSADKRATGSLPPPKGCQLLFHY